MGFKLRNKVFLILGFVCIVLGVVGYLIPGKSAESPVRIYYATAGGPVLFPHADHTEMDAACSDCHHELIRTDEVKSCKECHKEDDYKFNPEELPHSDLTEIHMGKCSNCHAAKEEKPKSCRTCHKATGEGEKEVNCERCHKDDGYSKADFAHADLTEIEGHWCTECHQTARIADAMHKQCGTCHNDLDEGTFFSNPDGDPSLACKMCHLKSTP